MDGGAFDLAADSVAAHYAAEPVTASVQVDDTTVTRHTTAGDDAVCVTGKRGTVRCHRPPLLNNGLDGPADSFELDFLVDSTCVHVGTLNAEPTEITATTGTSTTAPGSSRTPAKASLD